MTAIPVPSVLSTYRETSLQLPYKSGAQPRSRWREFRDTGKMFGGAAVSNNSIPAPVLLHPRLLRPSLEQPQLLWEMCIMPGLIYWLISSQWFVLSPDGQLKFTTGRAVPCWQAAAGPQLEAATEGAGPLLPFFLSAGFNQRAEQCPPATGTAPAQGMAGVGPCTVEQPHPKPYCPLLPYQCRKHLQLSA